MKQRKQLAIEFLKKRKHLINLFYAAAGSLFLKNVPEKLLLQLSCTKRITLLYIAGFVTFFKPVHTLGRCAMRK